MTGGEVISFTVTDTIKRNRNYCSDRGGATASLTFAAYTAATTETFVAALNASANATISAITWSNDGDTVYGAYDASGNQTGINRLEFNTNVTGAVTTEGGSYGISEIDTAIAAVASDRAKLGATQAQLESTVRNLASVAENTAAAAGRIMDTDYAAETANLTKAQILQQAATSILAQANAQLSRFFPCYKINF